VRAEHGDGDLTVNDVLPLIRIGVPVQLAQPARIKIDMSPVTVVEIGKREASTRHSRPP